MQERWTVVALVAALGTTGCTVNGKPVTWPRGSGGGGDAAASGGGGEPEAAGAGGETVVAAIPASGRPAWCEVEGADDISAPMVSSTLEETDPNSAVYGLIGHFCGEETTERRSELEATFATWSKRLAMNDADWKDAAEWALRPTGERNGPHLTVDDKRALSSLDAVEQYALISSTYDDPAYLADALGATITAPGRMAYAETCLRVDAVGAWAICHADVLAFDLGAISAEVRKATGRNAYERTTVRLVAARLRERIEARIAAVDALIAKDPAYGTLFTTAADVARTWAKGGHTASLELALAMDDARRTNSRSGFEGCDDKAWSAVEDAVAAVPAARYGELVESEDRSFTGRAASIVLDGTDAYLAANALLICVQGRGENVDYFLRNLALEMANRPGFRGPRTATHTALLAASVTLDDRDARIDYPGVQRRWLNVSGDRGESGQGVVASVKESGNSVVISFAKEMSTYTECTKWKATSRIDRIDANGNIYYEENCTKYTTKKFDKASPPQTVAARYATSVKKGVYVEVIEDVVITARAKQGGEPIAVFGVAVK